MTIEEPYCAVCQRQIDPASRHVQVEATAKGEDEPAYESYCVHLDCWHSLSDGWMKPA